jgi:threonine/homoserine/homoserine lactone efflux protein
MSLREAWRAISRDPIAIANTAAPSLHGSYVTGLLMTLVNPMTLAFWFVTLPGLLGKHSEHPTRELPMLCLGVCIGAAGWAFFFSSLLALAGRWRRPWWTAVADAIGGTILLAFAVRLLVSAVSR